MSEIIFPASGAIIIFSAFFWERSYNSRAKRIRDETISYTSPIALLIFIAPIAERIVAHRYYEFPILVRGVGALLLLFGVSMRIYFHITWFNIILEKRAKNVNLGIIDAGPYRYVRHPMWLGTYSMIIGLYFASSTLLGLLCFVSIWLPLGIKQIRGEEKKLMEIFGEDYRRYRSQHSCIIPFIW